LRSFKEFCWAVQEDVLFDHITQKLGSCTDFFDSFSSQYLE
jgi:hypothetical protein